jgi:hypothetical protein
MVNVCEPLINAVILDKPKMLIGLSQKARSTVWSLTLAPSWAPTATGGQRAPKPSQSYLRNTVNPYRPFVEVGTPRGEPTAVRAEDEGGSKCRLVMRRIRGATFPDAKAGRLPSGLSSREHLKNRLRK